MKPHIFEDGNRVYFVAPVASFKPAASEIEEFAFAQELAAQAPNQNIVWMRGQYVEADKPNLNGAMWTAGELAVKHLTPMFMPVTVMHDPRTAVGLIADVKLRIPEKDDVPRSKIDTALALWGHRFPEVVHEALENAKQGTLMQSMEAIAPDYDCAECGRTYTKLPDGAEREHWCDHLTGVGGTAQAARILRNVVFTGTGLIFGTRGAEGADPEAHLEVFQQEVAEYHQKAHVDRKRRTPRRKPGLMEIEDARYEELLKAEQERNNLRDEKQRIEDQAQKDVEAAEAAQKAAEKERDEAKGELAKLEETASQQTLANERTEKLGKGFIAALGEKTKTRLFEQAKTMSDDDWNLRLEELAELTETQPDDAGEGDGEGEGEGGSNGDGAAGEQAFTKEQASRTGAGKGGRHTPSEPNEVSRRSVVAGLVKTLNK